MGQSEKKAKRRREEEKEDVPAANWSELCPDLLRCVFKRLSFTNLNRVKPVCSSWYSSSKGCVPKPNQIPWLILFPSYNSNNSSSCLLFILEDRENVYKTRDLGIDFVQSDCLATYGSWLLMLNPYYCNLYIFNPLTGERIDLPYTKRELSILKRASFWIDNKTKDYLVVLMMRVSSVLTKKGDNKWQEFPVQWYKEIVYNHKNQKLYLYDGLHTVKIWDFSGDKLHEDGFLDCRSIMLYNGCRMNLVERRLAVTISGDVLTVACYRLQDFKTWRFHIYKANHVNREWVRIASLGNEALILEMGITVVAKDIPGIKRNSIYLSGAHGCGIKDQNNICVYDLTTQKMEPLQKCVFSSINFSNAQWFFPDFNG